MRSFYRIGFLLGLAWLSLVPVPSRADVFFQQTNLVTDNQSINSAVVTDPNLKNPWGIATNGGSPFWVSDNATGKATLYAVNPLTNLPTVQALTVTIPGAGNVTGQVASALAGQFNGNTFLFVSEDGTISGWRGALGTTAEILQTASSTNVYKGAAQSVISGHAYLYAANFRSGTIDVLKGDAGAPSLTGSFTDPTLPAGYAPFNIQNINGTIYVTYALQDGAMQDDAPGAGHGIVSAFDVQGNLLRRIATQGVLNSPWGLAIAPSDFGPFAGDLLVGNFGDGRINAYALDGSGLVGTLNADTAGNPLEIDGLWGLRFGSGTGNGGSSSLLYFTAGPNDEVNGLFGSIGVAAVPEPSSFILVALGASGLCFYRWRRRQV